jgi:hypothetical protein
MSEKCNYRFCLINNTVIFPKTFKLRRKGCLIIGQIQYLFLGARGSVMVKALCYKSEGRGFDSR